MGFPIAQQLPARHSLVGRCLVLGFEGDKALVIQSEGYVFWVPLDGLNVEWHLDTDSGQFVPDFEDYPDDEETDDFEEVPGDVHPVDRTSDGDSESGDSGDVDPGPQADQ